MTTGAGEYPNDDEKWCELHGQDRADALKIQDPARRKVEVSFLKKLFDIRFPNPEYAVIAAKRSC